MWDTTSIPATRRATSSATTSVAVSLADVLAAPSGSDTGTTANRALRLATIDVLNTIVRRETGTGTAVDDFGENARRIAEFPTVNYTVIVKQIC